MITKQMQSTQLPIDKTGTKKTKCWIVGSIILVIVGGISIYLITQKTKNETTSK